MMRIKGDPTGRREIQNMGNRRRENVKGNFCGTEVENKLYHYRSDLRMILD